MLQDAIFYNRDSATISADDFYVRLTYYLSEFHNEDGATISVDNFNVTAGNDFSNGIYATINADNFNVSARDFSNHILRNY